MPKRSLSPWTIEYGELHRLQLSQPALRRLVAAGRQQWEREAEHGHGIGLLDRPASHPCTEGASACHQRQPGQFVLPEMLRDGNPGFIKAIGGCRRPTPGDPVGLLHEGHRESLCECGVPRGNQVRRVHTATGAVAEHHPGARLLCRVHVGSCGSGWRLDLDRGHVRDSSSAL